MITRCCAAAPRPSQLCPRIRSEYLEMPGLNLTLAQACRLWDSEPWMCREALDLLVAAGFLVRSGASYSRADCLRRVARHH